MGWKQRLAEWNHRYDLHQFGWRDAWQCAATAVVFLGLILLLGELFPVRRYIIGIVTLMLCGFGFGFVYERNSGTPALLFTFSVIFAVRTLDRGKPFLVNVVWFALWVTLPLAGFGFSYLVSMLRRRRGKLEN